MPTGRNALIAHLLLFALIGLTAPALAAAPDARPYDRWYVVELGGSRAGWMHEAFGPDGDNLKSATRINLQIRRGPAAIDVSLESEFVETPDGEPVSLRSVQALGSDPVIQEFIFGADSVQIRSRQGDIVMPPSEAPLPAGDWLTPREVRDFIAARLEAGAETITYRTLDPSSGLTVVTMRHAIVERTQTEALGRIVPAVKWTSTTSLMPQLETTDYVDTFGVPIRSEIDLGGLKMTTILADRDLALAEIAPPELLISTLVKPDRPIDDPREADRAVYILSVADGDLADLPDSSIQGAERLGLDRVRLTIDLDNPAAAPQVDAADAALTHATAMADASDPEIRALVKRATEGVDPADKPARAEAMRRFVHRYIDEKNLDVGYATASETARTRAGDCTEHGTLLVAMLRADGIPARACSGLIYVREFAGQRNVFGYHMWSQALLQQDGKLVWTDLDATLDDNTPCDATHILLATTDLADGAIDNAMVQLAPLLGRLRIEVESVDAAG